MLDLQIVKNENDFNSDFNRTDFIDFLYNHLERFGDEKEAINKSIDYAFSQSEGKGGFLVIARYEGKVVGTLVMNNTGMEGYIPEFILVYVAVDSTYRGKGFGKEIVEKSIKYCKGDVALHVEYDNPAKRLYERIGFGTKYAEMRYYKEEK
ncbi:MAG: hypothetical protein SCALA702_12640 [Melioribacteraceae bacterium]|nr:MAG: hypothetical protein SCALA702_12640 [Melioribacteraceae bacterium]